MAIKPSSYTRLELTNIQNEETVYQRCLLVTGTCHDFSDTEDFITVRMKDSFHKPSPQQNWPAANGTFRCLLMLHAGPNKVDFELYHKGQSCGSTRIIIQYQPLLQLPPLHLAILVASDSPLLMDCPQAKRGAISTAHSSLDAAIVKLRMAAYMWQALLAEDFRLRGLGRRTFRLDEEWGTDTTTSASLQHSSCNDHMDTVAKIHVVRIERTVAELRAPHVALHTLFKQALHLYGGPFLSSYSPVVAGMILDSHYSHDQGRTLANIAEAYHYPSHVSLGVFGSHTTYSWPRFLEEVPSCLLDTTPIGDAVANDHGQCSTMSDSCCIGQGGMLDQIRQAFGVEGTSQPWKSNFIASWSNAFIAQPSRLSWIPWDLSGALRMWREAHFRLPGDRKVTNAEKEIPISLNPVIDENSELCIEVMCMAGIARIRFRGRSTAKDIDFIKRDTKQLDNTVIQGPSNYLLTSKALNQELDRRSVVELEILSMLGQTHKIRNIWDFLADQPFIKVPGTSLVLSKRSVKPENLDGSDLRSWALLLKKRSIHDPSGFATADRIDIRVGAIMDGGVVHYSDGSKCNCGVPSQENYGGHLSEDRALSESEIFRITRVSVNAGDQELNGCRMTLANNESWGNINNYNTGSGVQHLVCGPDERIIGFFGKSVAGSGYTCEFGIITAPRSVVDSEGGLPAAIYDMPELMNVHGVPHSVESSDSEDEGEMEL
ncbi:hypothetical protein HD806DRAFT_349920 [Xylariaceae sp. AK1471]|nr:hypothetical protein HD806DRAFT_458248 [Xylariaceae sp. AK1471]KAI3328092.1 hypothetical protein HD806DRAFT_349920 [Xylariaceae sp. AK1471]